MSPAFTPDFGLLEAEMNAATFTPEARLRLKAYLDRPGFKIPVGLGNEEAACSIAAINIAIYGKLTDSIPNCMSQVIGAWILPVQDEMPSSMRNSPKWKAALVRAAGSGREHERKRLDILMEWMWTIALPSVQRSADINGFGEEWRRMCVERSAKAAFAAKYVIHTTYAGNLTSYASIAASCAASAVDEATNSTANADAGNAASDTAFAAINALSLTVFAANVSPIDAWRHLDPIGLLEKLIAVSETAPTH